MSVLKVKNGNQWDIVPAIKGDTGDPAADESITDAMLVPDGIKTEIEWLWGNQLMDIREGELLQTDDAYEAPLVSLDVDGNSTQVVTTGKNLLDVHAYTESGKRINDNGEVVSVSGWHVSEYMNVSEMANVARSGFKSNSGVRDAFYDSEKELLQVVAHAPTVVAVPSGAAYMRCTYSNADRNSETMQYESGSAPTSYEPYTNGMPTPRPDYPQPIESVDEPELNVCGKNLLDKSSFTNPVNWKQDAGDAYAHFAMKFPAGITITAHYDGEKLVMENTYLNFGISKGSSANVFLIHNGTTTTNTTVTVTVPEDGKLYFNIYPTTAAGKQRVFDAIADILQLEAGSTATAYEPYAGTTVPDLLPEGTELRSLPDGTKDELHLSYLRPSTREGWAWYSRELVQRVATLTLDGSQNWSRASGQSYRMYTPCDNLPRSNDYTGMIMSNRFQAKQIETGVGFGNEGISAWRAGTDTPDNNWLYVYVDGITTAAAIKQWFADNITEVTHKLKEPITTQLDPIELPIMPSKDTTIWSDPSAQLKMTYIQDTNLVIESLEATVADMATS